MIKKAPWLSQSWKYVINTEYEDHLGDIIHSRLLKNLPSNMYVDIHNRYVVLREIIHLIEHCVSSLWAELKDLKVLREHFKADYDCYLPTI